VTSKRPKKPLNDLEHKMSAKLVVELLLLLLLPYREAQTTKGRSMK
jgi:hypothetical protein